MKRALPVIAGLLVLMIGVSLIAVLRADPGSDESQIRQALEDARLGAETCDVSRATACLSRDYRDSNGNTYASMRILAAQALRNVKPTIRLSVRSLDVQGDTGTAGVHLTVNSKTAGNPCYEGDLTLHLARETARRLLVFPGTRWRIVSVEGPMPAVGAGL